MEIAKKQADLYERPHTLLLFFELINPHPV